MPYETPNASSNCSRINGRSEPGWLPFFGQLSMRMPAPGDMRGYIEVFAKPWRVRPPIVFLCSSQRFDRNGSKSFGPFTYG